MNNGQRDARISGAGRLSGGEYREIKLSGAAYMDGEASCETLRASGSAHFSGELTARDAKLSGSAHVGGSLAAGVLRASGSLAVGGDLTVSGEMELSGSASAEGAIRAARLVASGGLRAGRGIECEQLDIGGSFRVKGLINAGSLRANLSGQSTAEEIGGEDIEILRSSRVLDFRAIFGGTRLTANSIEGNRVILEYTTASVVRGEEVDIGEGCDIGRVEYGASLTVAEGASVRERVKTGTGESA